MNTNATSNQSLRDVFVFLFGAALATVVLVVLYFALPIGKTDAESCFR